MPAKRSTWESETVVAQCKHVKRCSLPALAALAEAVEEQGRQRLKTGVVAIKLRQGAGRPSPTLIVMTASVGRQVHGAAEICPLGKTKGDTT
jgi:hypothetical protein